MVNTIDMKDMRQLNLFARVTRVPTRYVFNYNEQIVFCVPKSKLSQAIGPGGRNVRRISETIRRRVRILPCPKGISDARKFIELIVAPVTFKELEITDEQIILTAGSQSKAALFGRNKRRLLEMQEIVKDFFGLEFKII